MRRTHKAGVILGLGMLLSAPSASLGQAPERSPVVTTPHFAFYSDFDANLNDAQIAAGVARKGGKPELFHAGAEVACFDKLPESARAAWDGAVDYYAKIISPADWKASQQYLIRMQLAGSTMNGRTLEPGNSSTLPGASGPQQHRPTRHAAGLPRTRRTVAGSRS